MRRVLMMAAPIVLAVGLIVPFSVEQSTPAPVSGRTDPAVITCSDMCPMIYEPVNCALSDGVTRAFSNNCAARSYACEHELQTVGCVARRGSVGNSPV